MKPLRILVVEDNALIAIALAELLETQGHNVCAIVSTESDAVAAAARFKPEMMIVDAQLLEGSGIGAVDRIQCGAKVAHVFVTGDALSVRSLRPRATVIQKPYFEDDLNCALQRALDAAATAA
jgi:CheY-like chemotaxis protein